MFYCCVCAQTEIIITEHKQNTFLPSVSVYYDTYDIFLINAATLAIVMHYTDSTYTAGIKVYYVTCIHNDILILLGDDLPMKTSFSHSIIVTSYVLDHTYSSPRIVSFQCVFAYILLLTRSSVIRSADSYSNTGRRDQWRGFDFSLRREF